MAFERCDAVAFWKGSEEPQEASGERMSARERFGMLQEREDGLRALPVGEHRAFLKALYAKYPAYPGDHRKCSCVRCAGSAR